MRKSSALLLAGLGLLWVAAPAQAQNFGRGLAVTGDAVIIAEPANDMRAGIVYVYTEDASGAWVETAQLTRANAEHGDGFGAAIAVDGNTLLASRLGESEDEPGAVYVFERGAGGAWQQTAVLGDGLGVGPGFGAALALDGDYALITTAPASEDEAGQVEVYRRGAGGNWGQEAILAPSDIAAGDGFGAGLALDGDRAVITAPGQSDRRGAAYLFARDASGGWTETAKLATGDVAENAQLGASVALFDGRVVLGAPGSAGATGAVFVFEPEEDGEWEVASRLLPFDATGRAQFGIAVTRVGDELWIGSPGADDGTGAIYRTTWDGAAGSWTMARKLTSSEVEGGDQLGARIAAAGGIAAATAAGDDRREGTVVVFEQQGMGDWASRDKVAPEPDGYAAIRGGQVDCQDAAAAHFDCEEVDLLSFVPVSDMGAPRGIGTNDVWGWTDPQTGKEWAIVGRQDATAFVDISDPYNPVYVGELPMTEGARANSWRDMKVYDDHVFVVADGAGPHGMQIFDLTRLRNVGGEPVTFEMDAHYDRIGSAHNLVINEETGFAYIVGAGGPEGCGGGLHMVDIRNPTNPEFAGCYADTETGRRGTGYSHDAQCVVYRGPDGDYAGREICLGSNETALSIADVTDKDAPTFVARADYPNVGYSHQGWLTDDHRYFYMNDELDELQGLVQGTRTMIWDLEDLDDPQLVGEFFGATDASDHNLYVKGDLMYQSNYQAGLRVIDISDPENPREVGSFDTVPYGTNTPGFGGSWSNYPFFESGTVIVTSGSQGLFVVKVRDDVTTD